MPIVEVAEARWFLTALNGARAGMVWPINGTVTIGRHGDIEVEGPHVSRELLRLRAARTVRARRIGRSACSAGTFIRRPLPVGKWITLRRRTIITAGERFRLDERPRHRSPIIWMIAAAVVATAILVPFVLSGPAWRVMLLLAPIVLLAQGLRRRRKRITPLRTPLAILVSSHEGRAFHSEPHLPVRSLRTPLEGTGWVVRDESAARWLACYLAVWNDPDVLTVTSPWITTRGSGVTVVFGNAPPTRHSMAVTWGHRPQWALPLHLPRGCTATDQWARQLHAGNSHLPESFVFCEAVGTPGTSGMCVALARGADGPVTVNLADAPHALVAGATGSGKSELLTSWLLLMAKQNPPTRLNYVIIDFKGGATSSVLQGLPHVVDIASDLDPAGAQRIVTSLKAVLRSRESTLARHNARHISELADPPPLLVVVVDEFRALTDDVPDALDQLVRLTAHGRSLGVHLILATQRPGGAVSADMRANIPLRIALRTTERADSADVVGDDSAAHLPRIPGRAVLLNGDLTTVQIAWANDPAAITAQIASSWTGSPASAPWLPALPELTRMSQTHGAVAVVDHPEILDRTSFRCDVGHLVVIGPHGSGLTTAARTIGASSWLAGNDVWLISADPWDEPEEGFGGTIHPHHTRLVLAALTHAQRMGGVIVIDDVDSWAAVHDSLHGVGAAEAHITSALRSQARVVLLTHTHKWGRSIGSRVYLAGWGPAEVSLTGLARAEQQLLLSKIPGRAVIDGKAAQITVPDHAGMRRLTSRQARRFVPLPETTRQCAVAEAVCVGDDGNQHIHLPRGPVAIVGARGTGRSEAAHMIAAQIENARVMESPSPGLPMPNHTVIATTTPEGWSGGFGGILGHLRANAPLLLLRPDLCPRLFPEIENELEPGSAGYAVLVNAGAARALRLNRHAPHRKSSEGE